MKKVQTGFTLIEVLIALVILAIALVAVIKSTASSVRDTTHVKEKIIAHWVALNALSELQNGMIPFDENASPPSADVSMGGEHWHWVATKVSSASGADFMRVGISVNKQGSSKRWEHLEGFVFVSH